MARRGESLGDVGSRDMPVPYTYDRIRNTVDCRPFGAVVISEVAGFFDAVMADAEIVDGWIEVVYIEGVDDFRFSSSEAHTIPEKIRQLRDRKGLRGTVIIADSQLHFGMARMIQTLHELADDNYPTRVIRSEEELDGLLGELASESPPGP